MPIAKDLLQEILDNAVQQKSLELTGSGEKNILDRHRAFFIWRRAEALLTKYQAWQLEGGHNLVKTRVSGDFDLIDGYLSSKLGTPASPGPLLAVYGGTGDADPPHLDLLDLAQARTTDTPNSDPVKKKARENTRLRMQRAQGIVWRAAALQPDIWNDSPDGKTTSLKSPVLDEYLDRRLRILERMHFNVGVAASGFGGMGSPQWNFSGGAKGPWKDGFRVRVFEYPRMPLLADSAASSPVIQALGGVNAVAADSSPILAHSHDEPGDSHAATTDQHWKWGYTHLRIEWRVAPAGADTFRRTWEWRFPASQRASWQPNYTLQFTIDLVPPAGTKGSAAIDALFDYRTHSREDFWERSWLWCDHAIAACHLEAFLFSQRRRYGKTAGDKILDDLVDSVNLPPDAAAPYVGLRSVVRGSTDVNGGNEGALMVHTVTAQNNPDRHFENIWLEEADLQIGDHAIFWNHVLYQIICSGDWRLENSLIMGLESTPDGKVLRKSIQLQGHGTRIGNYADFQSNIASHLQWGLTAARKKIRDTLEPATGPKPAPADTRVVIHQGYQLVQWSPFGNVWKVRYALNDPTQWAHNAWWVEIPLDITLWDNQASALQGLPKTVAYDPAGNFTEAPPKPLNRPGLPQPGAPPYDYSKVVYFPLFEPGAQVAAATGDPLQGWEAYLEQRKHPNPPALTLLQPVLADGKLVKGLYWRDDHSLPVVRPKAKP